MLGILTEINGFQGQLYFRNKPDIIHHMPERDRGAEPLCQLLDLSVSPQPQLTFSPRTISFHLDICDFHTYNGGGSYSPIYSLMALLVEYIGT